MREGGHQRGGGDGAFLTTFVALPLRNLQREVERADGEVDSLGVHSSHLADKRGSQITFQRTLFSLSLSLPSSQEKYTTTIEPTREEERKNDRQEREAERKTRNRMKAENRKRRA